MLRVSEFCRSPFHHRQNVGNKDDVALNTSDSGCLFVSVNPRPLQSGVESIARVSIEVLKALSLCEGDFAVLQTYTAGYNQVTSPLCVRVSSSVVVCLELMDNEEEKILKEYPVDCLVSPVVWANLGILRCDTFTATEKSIHSGCFIPRFRLLPIYEGEGVTRYEQGMIPNRIEVATHVLLRPLGREVNWQYSARRSNIKSFQETGVPRGHGGSTSSTDSGNTEIKYHDEGDNRYNNDDIWIFPSCSGVVLQESTLCGVLHCEGREKDKNLLSTVQPTKYYYEVLRIRSTEETIEGDDLRKVNEIESIQSSPMKALDHVVYVTGPKTKFELDSKPLTSLSYIRRLPIPTREAISVASDTTEKLIVNVDPSRNLEKIHAGVSDDTSFDADERRKTDVNHYNHIGNNDLISDHTKNEAFGAKEDGRISRTSKKLFSTSQTSPSLMLPPKNHPRICGTTSSAGWCHPDWKKVADALLHAPVLGSQNSLPSTPSAFILHLVGNDRDHDLRRCVNAAASHVGMTCLAIRGLAAFAHENPRRSSQSQVTVRSPMIEQNLAGIEAAFDYVRTRRMEPCVVHFYDVDEELKSSTMTGDDDLRCQIEDRFWWKWLDGLSTIHGRGRRGARKSTNQYNATPDELDYRYTPRVIVVVSTSSPLKKGPWLDRLIFPSISLSFPDDSYIRCLWEGGDQSGIDSEEENNLVGTLNDEMLPVLRGRPVQEIIQLRRKMLIDLSYRNAKASTIQTIKLESLCAEFDKGRRKRSSDVSLISDVSWQDVGGLDHVRAEIMDAIELPLKHPKLFPKNTGRSGILLFGPPGTGKTLVAKAVATECKLPFLSVKGPELLGSYVGESEANIRRIFQSARVAASENIPIAASILFFDELDSLAPKRGEMNHGGGVMERVVASLLSELDGGGSNNPLIGRVFVLGATNRPDLLDPSLLRPGRLDRLVYLGIPTTEKDRTNVLVSQLSKMKLEGGATEMAHFIAKRLPPRLSGADLSKLSSGAMLHALRRLCFKVEEEKARKPELTVGQILDKWGDEKCTPTVTLDDLIEASSDVSPSISAEEIERYERLRVEHCTSGNR